MSTLASPRPAPPSPSAMLAALRGQRRHRAWPLWALTLLALVFVGGREAEFALRSPGEVIRSELTAAAVELAAARSPQPREAALRAIRSDFRAHSVMLDTRFWPQVTVTLPHLDRATCIDARRAAGRIEGLVVIELEHYGSADDCGDDNAMTWWIAP